MELFSSGYSACRFPSLCETMYTRAGYAGELQWGNTRAHVTRDSMDVVGAQWVERDSYLIVMCMSVHAGEIYQWQDSYRCECMRL